MNTVSRTPFGCTPSGEAVEKVTLETRTLSCSIITYGAILQTLHVPGQTGTPLDIVLGFDSLEEYLANKGYIGATIGRFANRITAGRFWLDGKEYTLATNAGPNHIHGGIKGFSNRVWTISELSPTHVTLSLFSPDGEEGFPGNMNITVTYQLDGSALSIQYWAETDRATPCNLTNHSYFNLNGHACGSIADHRVTIHAARYTPIDKNHLVLGHLESVVGTPMDLRKPAAIADRINAPFQQLRNAKGYDHNYAIDGSDGSLRTAAQVFSPDSGITMTVETTQPGIQFYTVNSFRVRHGKSGAIYRPRSSFCLEPQGFPDAPNHPNFPNCFLRPGGQYIHITRLLFSRSL